jgi:hypothetical protein
VTQSNDAGEKKRSVHRWTGMVREERGERYNPPTESIW